VKTAVVTGASSGIGLVVARELARSGWHVIALGRNPERIAAALADIHKAAPQARVDMVRADFSVMAEVARAANEVAALTDRIDLLVNNAGGTPSKRIETADGLEETFAANHLATFLLTQRLLPLVRAAGPGAQIIVTSSVAHKFIKDMVWDDLQLARKFDAGKAYTQSKLANILFVRALAPRVAADGIRVNAVHPGFVASNFPSHGNLVVRMMYALGRPVALTNEEGADTILWLAEGGSTLTGEYFVKRKPAATTPAAQSREGAERLWSISEVLAAKWCV
jgi:retinol dehydrogenase 12